MSEALDELQAGEHRRVEGDRALGTEVPEASRCSCGGGAATSRRVETGPARRGMFNGAEAAAGERIPAKKLADLFAARSLGGGVAELA
ncbi:hypothetical protein SAMN02745121_05177 [Nannocystis exedens]|uniref:Uncharacterized protein n=1 Tax=Nannocystis exedens TaxID=54 RepID=A0A1I2CJH7_9BACT|nr:hypothetical protein [Nannocystis exedens]PCC68255.1 hypothetical protein NAEX_01265 [Nannocystis exedens]SFE68461.1 hypothetical protein SAMN02745121_05177 [Nannocystis exedens]